MDEVVRGARELVRTVLRENGIKHTSNDFSVSTICYAQQPLISISYVGPVIFNFDDNIINITVYGLLCKNGKNGDIWSLVTTNDSIDDARQTWSSDQFIWTGIIEHAKLDISDPHIDVKITQLLNKRIKPINKRPAGYKLHATDNRNHYIPDIDIDAKMSIASKIKSWFSRLFKQRLLTPDEQFYYIQAMRRHSKLSEEETIEVLKTARALVVSGLSRYQIKRQTAIITGDE